MVSFIPIEWIVVPIVSEQACLSPETPAADLGPCSALTEARSHGRAGAFGTKARWSEPCPLAMER